MKFLFLKTFLILFVVLTICSVINSVKIQSNVKEEKCKFILIISY